VQSEASLLLELNRLTEMIYLMVEIEFKAD